MDTSTTSKWISVKDKVVNKIESLITKHLLLQPLKRKVDVNITVDNFGVVILIKLGDHSRFIYILLDELAGNLVPQFSYTDRIRMQLDHLYNLDLNSSLYSNDDQISHTFSM